MLDQDNAPKFDAPIYGKIALNDLVTYAVYYLTQNGEEITAEDLVAACFFMFPQRFSLRGYNQWPDSTVVNKRWVDCRNKHLISGNTANGFNLTPKGLELAEKTGKALKGERAVFSRKREGNVRSEMRTRAGRFVRALEDSDAYRAFNQSKAPPSEFDFRSMLLCTMESSPDTLRSNLQQFEQHATLYARKDLVAFLDFCRDRFEYLLEEAPKASAKNRGGMLKQKIR